MNYRNFEKPKYDGTETEAEKFVKATPGSGRSFGVNPSDIISALENEYEMFVKITEILARQEYRKRRFYRNLKKAIIAIFSIFVFSGIFIFAKNRKSGRSEKTKKSKN